MAKLSAKQERFVEEYLIDLNATQAAIRAGYSVKSANEQGSRLLANVSIRTCIDQAMAERSRRTGISQDRVIRELARLAFVNLADVVDMGKATVLVGATEDDTAAIASVKIKAGEDFVEREIKLIDKVKPLELLGKHLGMFKDRLELSGEIGITDALKNARERVKNGNQ